LVTCLTNPVKEPMIVRRDDGSWLLDGALDLDPVFRTLRTDSLVDEADRQRYHTLGGFAMLSVGRVPRTGDRFEKGDFRFEVRESPRSKNATPGTPSEG
jgi:putative hemolysin